MTLTLVTPPVMPISLEEAIVHLRNDTLDEATYIDGLIAAAYSHAEAWTGKSFAASTWDYALPAFPSGAIRLPRTPVQSVASISYFDADNASQALTAYRLTDGTLAPVSSWPAAFDRADAVTIRFTAGGIVPPEVKSAMLLMVGHWFTHREAVAEGTMTELPLGVYALLNLHRQMFV